MNQEVLPFVKPKFKLAKIDETSNWGKDIRDIGKKIFGIYLYDENVHSYNCSVTPCYEMHFIESVSEDIPTEDIARNDFLEDIEKGDLYTEELCYKTCREIDSLPKENNVDYSDYDPSKDEYADESSYYELVADLIVEYRGNPTF